MPRLAFFLYNPCIKWRGFLILLLTGSILLTHYYISIRYGPAVAVLPLTGYVIAVDPGHGGYDPGVKIDNISEKDIVLEISFYLREMLQQGGAEVFMTREEDKDLLELPTGPKKHTDLVNRLRLVEEAGSEILVSIHLNAMTSPHWSGAQTFYGPGKEKSRQLALFIQEELIRVLKNTHRKAKEGDYFILHNLDIPAVIVETGFLSNPGEARLFQDPSYQRKVAWAIYLGIIRYAIES